MSYITRNANRAKGHFALTPQWEKDRDTERGPCFWNGTAPKAKKPFHTVDALAAYCEVNNRDLTSATEYGEPGYTGPTAPACILIANWNEIPESLQKRLEAQGYELEWSDEWYVDGGRTPSKAWRTEPDSHGWESHLRYIDGDILTPDDDAQDWIDDALNSSPPLPSWFDETELTLRGFAKINQADKEVGFHPGQNETPEKVGLPELVREGYDVILQVTERGQFDASYCMWTRKEATRGVLFDGASGIYIPQRFAKEMDRSRVTGVSEEDYSILEKGPPGSVFGDDDASQDYDETWTSVLENARITMTDGTTVRLEQDGDVFYIDTRAEFCEYEDNYYTHK